MTGNTLDLSYHQALPVLTYQATTIHLKIVGLGGTGGFLARHAACLVWLLCQAGKKATLTFIDPDVVEEANIPRQNFCQAELGKYKAQTLAERFSQALGMQIGYIPNFFAPEMARPTWNTLTVIVGCVDRASGRVAMEKALAQNNELVPDAKRRVPRLWYLDLGSGLDFGQVVLGSTDRVEDLASAFCLSAVPGCSLLPSPLLQQPKLREPRPEEHTGHTLSCAELLKANAQAMTINAAMADEGADYLYRLLVTGTLKRFATFIDLPSGTRRSSYTTPEMLASVIGRDPSFFTQRPA